MTVHVDAQRSNRSLTAGQPDRAASLRARRIVLANPVLLGWRRFVDMAVADAKKTRDGMPTGGAISARWWIADYRPDKPLRNKCTKLMRMEYAGSFECCCEMLGWDVDAKRKEYLAEIDDALVNALVRHAGDAMYQARARVLTCAGVPTAVARQFVLGLVHPDDYDDVADPAEAAAVAKAVRRERRAARRPARKQLPGVPTPTA